MGETNIIESKLLNAYMGYNYTSTETDLLISAELILSQLRPKQRLLRFNTRHQAIISILQMPLYVPPKS